MNATCTVHVPRGIAGSSAVATRPGGIGAAVQFWLTIEKSDDDGASTASWPIVMLVMVRGCSPVFWTTTPVVACWPTAVAGKATGSASSVPTEVGPAPFRLESDVSASVIVPPSCSWW